MKHIRKKRDRQTGGGRCRNLDTTTTISGTERERERLEQGLGPRIRHSFLPCAHFRLFVVAGSLRKKKNKPNRLVDEHQKLIYVHDIS